MKITLLFCIGMLTCIGAIPAAATPAFDAALLVSQAALNPIYMDFGNIEDRVGAMQGISELISDHESPSVGLQKIGIGVLQLADILDEAAKANDSTDAAGRRIIDCEGFAAMTSRLLNNKQPELVKFAADGWDLSTKRATAKFASLAKTPSFEGTRGQIIAILTGMIEAARTETVDNNEQLISAITDALGEEKQVWQEIEVPWV